MKSVGWRRLVTEKKRNEEKRARKRARDARTGRLFKKGLFISLVVLQRIFNCISRAMTMSNLQEVRSSVYVVFPYFDEIRSFPRLFFRPSRLANYQRRKNNDVILLRGAKGRRIISRQLLKLVNKLDDDSDELSRSMLSCFFVS